MRLSEFSAEFVADVLAELRSEAADFVRDCDPDAPLSFETKGYFRYVGQGWEIPVDLPEDAAGEPEAGRLKELFEAAYQTLFGRIVHGLDVEITSWSVRASTPAVPAPPVEDRAGGERAAAEGTRALYDPARQRHADAALIRRETFEAGQSLTGPAVVTERETTVIVPRRLHRDHAARRLHRSPPPNRGVPRSDSEGGQGRGPRDMTHTDIALQVMWNRLISVVEEQALALVRTAFSTTVREAGDLSAGVYDPDGRMLAQAVTGTPGHVNAMADAVKHFMREIGATTWSRAMSTSPTTRGWAPATCTTSPS